MCGTITNDCIQSHTVLLLTDSTALLLLIYRLQYFSNQIILKFAHGVHEPQEKGGTT